MMQQCSPMRVSGPLADVQREQNVKRRCFDPSETFKYSGAGQDASLRRPSSQGRGATMDVLVWLRSLGLERYEAAFRDNEIDERVLPSLTQEDLKEIGVGPVGHRRKLLDAITALRTDATANPSGDAVSSPPS